MSKAIYFSNYALGKWQDLVCGAQAWTPPATLYWERFTTVPTAANTGGVVAAYTGYLGRVAQTNNATNWPASSSQEKHNAGLGIQWPINLGTAEAHAGYAAYDDPTAGNLIVVVKFASAITIQPGQIPFVAPGDFSLTVQNSLTTPALGGVFESNYLIAARLDHILGASAYSTAATHYMARYTASPTAANASGTEAAYTNYARKSYTNNLTSYAASALLSTRPNKTHAIDIVPTAAGSGPTSILDWVIADASSGGNYLLILHSANALSLLSGGTDDVPAGAMNWTQANA